MSEWFVEWIISCNSKSRVFLFYCSVQYTAISRKVVGKSARENPERYCGWL